MLRCLCSLGFLIAVMLPGVTPAQGTVDVLYAGSLANVMERTIGPAFAKATGAQFQGYAGGSNKLANEIKAGLRRGDVFVSANPITNEQLMGEQNGAWTHWYIVFAESPLVIGYNPSSRFAADFKAKPWYEVLMEPGIKIGRTDPKLDPKGAFTVELLQRAEELYKAPGLAQKILGSSDNPRQVFPEEVLVGRFQSGELDVGFFYSTEAFDAKMPFVKPSAEIDPKARYTAAVLRDAPHATIAEQFVAYLVTAPGRELLRQHGIDLLKPIISGDVQQVPADIRSHVDRAR